MSVKESSLKLELDFGPDGSGLIPVITQDATSLEVLILSYVNKEAFEQSIKTRFATYFSRSRNEIWVKGATSGNKLRIVDIRINCEQNSLLYLVEKTRDGACHAKNNEGVYYSTCYYRSLGEKGELKVIL